MDPVWMLREAKPSVDVVYLLRHLYEFSGSIGAIIFAKLFAHC